MVCPSFTQAVVGDHPVLVVATPTSTDQPDTLQCYQLKDGSLHPVASSPVADYLSSHTLLLRATSSLSTHLCTSKTSKGAVSASRALSLPLVLRAKSM